MQLTPIDIQNKEFRKGVHGYRVEEVEKFLEIVVKDYEIIYGENHELRQTIQRLEKELNQYKQLESTLQQTMVIAQQTADEVKLAAKQQAELIIREAELEKEKTLSDANRRLKAVNEEIEDLQNRKGLVKAQLKSFLRAHLDMAEAFEEDRVC